MASTNNEHPPVFSAVSSSARQLFQLLRCISFATKAQVQITEEGLRFTVEDSRVMQGLFGVVTATDALLIINRFGLSRKDPFHHLYIFSSTCH